ncbi:sensor histidine kinase [Aureimonas leprariae]|uniref:histidine kinase n=1 Tax=Plantimonas leprariae TaxID=2615207 RepID=A0A7V7PPU0_9HYPH|nr:sensor histidine kinase [Aureimonas leprariae]KAB0680103.1 histidine kinase [Aureimonas leprariae]
MPFTKTDRHFGRFVLAAVAAGFAALVIAVLAVAYGISRQQEHNAWVLHTYQVETALTEFRFWAERIEVVRRGQLLQPDQRFVDGYARAREEVPKVVERIAALTADNPSQQARVAKLRDLAKLQIDTVGQVFDRPGGVTDAEADKALFSDGSFEAIRQSRATSVEMIEAEQRLLADRQAAERRSVFTTYAILAVAGLVALLVAASTIWLVRRNLNEVKASRDALRGLNENLEGAVAARTADLQRANDEIQRFAYIVSHDLRSPLVNVMGFTAELDAATKPLAEMVAKAEADAPHVVSEDARLAVKEDLPEAIGFIRSSTQKMDRLINAILRLSREGRRVITPERLKVAEILDGISASLAHRTSEIGAEIAVAKPLPDVVSDRLAVEQIFSNLVENAMKYAERGRPVRITVRGRNSGGKASFDVEDNGRGIDPRDHERIFDLFRRSGTQDQPGEGIGLAHVRALAYRLGGNVSCRSEVGVGSTFTLTLPSVYKPPKEA